MRNAYDMFFTEGAVAYAHTSANPHLKIEMWGTHDVASTR